MPNCGEIITALNVKLGINDSFERQTEDAALNAKWKRDMMVLNAKLKMRRDNERKICPSAACRYNSQSTGRVWKRLHESRNVLCWRVGMVKPTINMASQPIGLNHETWWCVTIGRTPLNRHALLEGSILVSKRWPNGESQESSPLG